MRRGFVFVATVLAAMTVLGSGTAVAVPPPAPQGFQYVAAEEHVIMAIVCPGTGTCSATYSLSENPGTETVGSTLSATPLEYIFHATGSSEPFGTFTADETLEPEYVLRADKPISGQVTQSGFIGGSEFGADSTVEVVLKATRAGSGASVDLGSATVNKLLVTPTAEGRVYPFSFTVPAELEGVAVRDLSLDLYVRGISLLQNGFVDGEGGSFFDLPYYELVPTA